MANELKDFRDGMVIVLQEALGRFFARLIAEHFALLPRKYPLEMTPPLIVVDRLRDTQTIAGYL